MKPSTPFGADWLGIDAAAEASSIGEKLRRYLGRMHRKGVVVAMSGGIDSSVVAALCVAALGKEKVFGLLLPERDSSADTLRLSRLAAESLGIQTVSQDISPVLEAVGCYNARDEAISLVSPDYGPGCKAKIVLPSVIDSDAYRLFSVVILTPQGREIKARLTPEAYLGIVAATNFKQRVRKMLEYYHADRLNYAVAGTPNRLEYDQGFFVKLGDGAADVKPIAHFYKSQVYQMAAHLRLPAEIQSRAPTTDTYAMPQSQEEFYFSLPYAKMDLCLYGKNNAIPLPEVAAAAGLSEEQVRRVYRDIDQKRATTEYLHLPPQLLGEMAQTDEGRRSQES
jgi:NAD+ synthase